MGKEKTANTLSHFDFRVVDKYSSSQGAAKPWGLVAILPTAFWWLGIFSGLMTLLSATSSAQLPTQAEIEVAPPSEIQGYEASFPALGTLVEIRVFSANEKLVSQVVDAAKLRAKAIEYTLTDYDPDSEASMLTELAAGENFVSVTPDLWNMLVASEHWHKISEGAFDASLGSLTQLWRASRRNKKPISEDVRKQAVERSGWRNVELNFDSKSVRFKRDGIRMDFGAIGKGYVVDELFRLFDEAGLKQTLINISGNCRFGDPPPDREGWRVEIAPLEKGQPIMRRLLLKNTSIATSGDLWQFTLIDGVRHSHILDPRNGKSVRGPIAATIIAPTATDADACATAVCVLGPTDGAQLLRSLPRFKGLILEHSDSDSPVRYITTEGFSD